MADCFDNNDPSSCQGLGTKLRNIDVSASAISNSSIIFDKGDWTVLDDCTFELVILPGVHAKGVSPISEVQKSVSGDWKNIGIEKYVGTDGTIRLRTVRRPDGRFTGRILVDG